MSNSPRAVAVAIALSIISASALGDPGPATGPVSASAVAPATQPATQPATPPTTAGGPLTLPSDATALNKVTVSADLDQARQQIAPRLGASAYTIGLTQIQNLPGGENSPFNQVLLRAPGVVPDSFGGEHVRGEHANLTYRINGVLLPQPLESFAQELDSRIIQSATLIDGTLPAQFGFHTAGIVDVITKSGATLNHNEISLYGGSFDTISPSFQVGGTMGRLDYFITGSEKHSDLGIENPTDSYHALHDYTDQQRLFGYFNFTIDDTSRVSLLLNASNSDFQIPNSPGVAPAFPVDGQTNTDSRFINENQNQQEYYTVIAYQKTFERLSTQVSVFSRYADVHFRPDIGNDLVFQGVGGTVYNGFLTNGLQFDASYLLNDQHTLRGGLIADYTVEKLNTSTALLDVDPNTGDTSTTPRTVVDDSGNNAVEAGIYLQDEFSVTPTLTLNYGFRYDRFDSSFDHDGQLSPRVNLVWKADELTTFHLGYARYFVPPPVQNVGAATLAKFQNTTNAPDNFLDDAPKVERSNYYDVGVSREIIKGWQMSIDGFYKEAHNLIDLGQFGTPVILAPFNYAKGRVYGAELSSTYSVGGLSLFQNFSFVRAFGQDPNSQQFLWANDELAYAQQHSIHLDHESEFTVSAGAAYKWPNDRVYIDFLLTTGLRSGFDNTESLPVYYPVNIGYEHVFRLDTTGKQAIRWRIDVVNLLDEKYQIRDGSGVGVGAPQYGERLGFFTGISYEF